MIVNFAQRMCLGIIVTTLSLPVWSLEPEQKVLRLGTFEFYRESSDLEVGERLVRASLAEHGYVMALEYFPGKRLMVQLNNGRLDGDLYRAVNLSRAFDNIVRVDEPILNSCGLIFRLASRQDIDIHNRASSLHIGVYDGAPAVSNELLRLYPNLELVFIKKVQQGIDMLNHGRVELLILPQTQETVLRQRLDQAVDLVGAIELPNVYLHLHSRHRLLAQDLVPTLQRLKRDFDTKSCSLAQLQQRVVTTP